ncbi:hypothetical protein ACFWE5_10985 [Cellulosimicrobium funkei]|uniref:hypothetical protein n=1 Tax=Cellulosimicrobium funkei TaxID=264251 RepID=UPI0036588BC1
MNAPTRPRPAASEETVTLWRPTGPTELDLARQSGRAWPPRLPEQPISYDSGDDRLRPHPEAPSASSPSLP